MLRHVFEREARAFELGTDRGRPRRHSARVQGAARLVGHARDDDLGTGGPSRRLGDDLHGLVEAPGQPQRQRGLGKRIKAAHGDLDLPLFWTHSHPDPAKVWSRGDPVARADPDRYAAAPRSRRYDQQ
jgi:hypothetical protein